jgi:hypothetical protein
MKVSDVKKLGLNFSPYVISYRIGNVWDFVKKDNGEVLRVRAVKASFYALLILKFLEGVDEVKIQQSKYVQGEKSYEVVFSST